MKGQTLTIGICLALAIGVFAPSAQGFLTSTPISGTATLIAGNVVVSTANVKTDSKILITCQDPNSGIPGAEYISARVAGTSFTIHSSVGDTCIVAWEIFP